VWGCVIVTYDEGNEWERERGFDGGNYFRVWKWEVK
jgi:hypothetical protein